MTPKIEKGLLIVVSGPSGVGKGTLVQELVKENSRLFFSISATTRAPRGAEKDGIDYYFFSEKHFLQLVTEGRMLEFAKYSGNYYGTPAQAVEDMRLSGKDVILEIDVQGALQIKEKIPETVMIMVLPPSLAVLEARLRGRGTETEQAIAQRLSAATGEIQAADKYEYVIINDDLQKAKTQLTAVIAAEGIRQQDKINLIKEVL